MRQKASGSQKGKGKETISIVNTRKRKVRCEESSDDFEDPPRTTEQKTGKIVEHVSTSNAKNPKKAAVATAKQPEVQKTDKEWAKGKRNTKGKLGSYKHVETRSSPNKLVEAIEALKKLENNEDKLKTLEYIDFSGLMDLELHKQPHSLCSWLLDHFDENKCSIEFPDGRSIEITDVDVHRCLGLPLGGGGNR